MERETYGLGWTVVKVSKMMKKGSWALLFLAGSSQISSTALILKTEPSSSESYMNEWTDIAYTTDCESEVAFLLTIDTYSIYAQIRVDKIQIQ